MIPWSYWWRIWLRNQSSAYRKLWREHPGIIILAALGVAFLARLALRFR